MLVQKLRLQRGWSQEQLAELSGLSVRTIQRLERGQSASVETLKSVASVFEIDFSRLQEPGMDTSPTKDIAPDEALAFAQVRRMRAFYIHLVRYVVITAVLAVVNLLTYREQLWFVWAAIGWGAFVALHGLTVWRALPFLGPDWERREVEKRLGRQL